MIDNNLMKNSEINLRGIEKMDYRFLYNLLKQRKISVNISHKKMPSFEKHVKFIMSNPYDKWKIVLLNKKKIGSVYLTKNNEIGITIIETMKRSGIENIIFKKIFEENNEKRYLVNISPKNKRLQEIVKKNNFKLIQNTYELDLRDEK